MASFDGSNPIVPDSGNMNQTTKVWTKGSDVESVSFVVSDTRRLAKLVVFLETS
jgi:hypothetical protein